MSQQPFNCPDLGEGLHDATVLKVHVTLGERVRKNHPMLTVETAKSIVDIPVPQDGKLSSLLVKEGEKVVIDQHLLSITIDSNPTKALPAARKMASDNHIDLSNITPADGQVIRPSDIHAHLEAHNTKPGLIKHEHRHQPLDATHVCTIFDDATLPSTSIDITPSLMIAMQQALINHPFFAHNPQSTQRIGLAIQKEKLLNVVCIELNQHSTPDACRQIINQIKKGVFTDQCTSPQMILSNIGMTYGKYATAQVIPPALATLAIGRMYECIELDENNQCRRITQLPLSLSFDHRSLTGLDASTFLHMIAQTLSEVAFEKQVPSTEEA